MGLSVPSPPMIAVDGPVWGVIAKNTSMRVDNTAPALPFIKGIDKSSHSPSQYAWFA